MSKKGARETAAPPKQNAAGASKNSAKSPISKSTTKTDSTESITELKEIVRKFCLERDWDQFHSPKELAIGVSTEGSELLELFRFKSDEEVLKIVNETKRTQVGEELADVLYFVLRFAQKFGFDLTEEFHKKMAKNSARYPVEKARGTNKKYSELD